LVRFEWNRQKADLNLRKHGVSFEEASSVFGDSLSRTVPDPVHSEDEGRLISVGLSDIGRLLVVVHTERGDTIRLISARVATKRERIEYEEDNT
jgi:uncharacterized protein